MNGNICQAFGAIFCYFFLLAMFAEFCSLILAIAEQIHEASYYVTLISSSDSLKARLTGWKWIKKALCQGFSEASFDAHLRISSCNARFIVMKDETS